MMLCRDARRRWFQYGINRSTVKGQLCVQCKKKEGTEIDHIDPLGARPRLLCDLPLWLFRMINGPCQNLCKKCHLIKTAEERTRRKKNSV